LPKSARKKNDAQFVQISNFKDFLIIQKYQPNENQNRSSSLYQQQGNLDNVRTGLGIKQQGNGAFQTMFRTNQDYDHLFLIDRRKIYHSI
jgi:hypothetical protein